MAVRVFDEGAAEGDGSDPISSKFDYIKENHRNKDVTVLWLSPVPLEMMR